MKSGNEVCQGGFSCPWRSNKCDGLAFFDGQVNLVQNAFIRIGKHNIPEFDCFIEACYGQRIRILHYGLLLHDQFLNALNAGGPFLNIIGSCAEGLQGVDDLGKDGDEC